MKRQKRSDKGTLMKRSRIMLGATERTFPGTEAIWSLAEARSLFLKTLMDDKPAVFEDLRKSVFPRFIEVRDKIFSETFELPDSGNITILSTLRQSPTFAPLLDALIEWTRRYRLDADWVKEYALGRMEAWCQGSSDSDSQRETAGAKICVQFPDLPPLTFDPVEYYPTAETAREFKTRALNDFEQALDQYITRVHDYYDRRGSWPRPKIVELREMDHFKWLIRYQVEMQSYGRIARGSGRERKSIETAVKRLAGLIELPLRSPSPPGRPKGSRDQRDRRRPGIPTIAEKAAGRRFSQ
jgi:hypothetical protein